MANFHRFSNRQLAQIFEQIADLSEIKGEVIYKVLAYRRAAESLAELNREAFDIWQSGKLTEIPGVGKAIAEKIEELFTTGRLGFLEKLTAEVPPSLAELLAVPDLGPKKIALFWKELGITTLAELEEAARTGKLRTLPGMGEKSEARVLAGIEAYKRRSERIPIGRAYPFAQRLIARLQAIPGVQRVEMAGSLRRGRSTVGDIDLLAAAADSSSVMEAFLSDPEVVRVTASGETKSSVEYSHGLRAQLWVHPPERFGTAWQYATGSKEHNVRLRELALKQGWSLSEHALSRKDGSEVLCSQEEEVYAALGLPWIPPELREDRGEIQAALEGKLPRLIQLSEIRSELHAHTTWSDGKLTIAELAEAARKRGLEVLVISDHSASLAITGGLTAEAALEQRREIQRVQEQLGDSIRLLHGIEVEIRADGSLDFPDEVLAGFDLVTASMHTALRQPRQQVTERLLKVLRNPHVDILGHPTGRMFPNREGADLDMEAVLRAAREHNVVLEINAHPSRLDLDDLYARRYAEMGGLLAINTDAHAESDFDLLHFGVTIARRAWVEAESVINTWPLARLLAWLGARHKG
ncbi:MAG: DNA polymerase/3'-5' exonuclease PolX [Anaerolineales bacterium]|nr:DNA polymerase/3'-5' exonuclease PolX [Anaerolineales bacterium]MDW8161741.1 DNA polymerase/3'-5' exonuclease PolX [Anaerolineales bacterium]